MLEFVRGPLFEPDVSMQHAPSLTHAMTPFPYSVDIEAPVEEAVRFMREHKIRHLPVTDSGRLAGVVSDRDIKLMLGPDFAYPDARELKVRDVFVGDSYSVELSTPLAEVLSHMAEHRLGSALVTRNGKLVGVFTTTDACRAFAQHLRETFPPPAPDAVA
jgi:acetoin utilization protein AcuB